MGIGKWVWEGGSGKAESGKWKVGSGKREEGIGKWVWEGGSGKAESGKWKVGSRKREGEGGSGKVESWKGKYKRNTVVKWLGILLICWDTNKQRQC